MPIYRIHHTTTYRYREPVGFGEHRMLLRPRDDADQQLVSMQLTIAPEPASLDWLRDESDNLVGVARFKGRARELRFDSLVGVDHVVRQPFAEPFQAAPPLAIGPGAASLDACRERRHGAAGDAVADWAKAFPRGSDLDRLAAMSRSIRGGFEYLRRTERGIQEPAATLRNRTGTCRDFTLLMMEAVRALGLPARFVTGYLYVPTRDRHGYHGGGSTHAWLQAWLSGAGWVDFDPTNAIVGNRDLIRVAVAAEPGQALPLTGTFIGPLDDDLGMEVVVHVSKADAQENSRQSRAG